MVKTICPEANIPTSFPGKLMMQANLWSTDFGELRGVLEENSDEISDACFSLQKPCIATSSLEKTVKVGDVEKVSTLFA